MSHFHHWAHLLHSAHHDKKGGKGTGIFLIIIGFFLAPMLIGIPLIFIGFKKLFS